MLNNQNVTGSFLFTDICSNITFLVSSDLGLNPFLNPSF